MTDTRPPMTDTRPPMTDGEFKAFKLRLAALTFELPSEEEFDAALEYHDKNPTGDRKLNELSDDTLKLWAYFARMNRKIGMEVMQHVMKKVGFGST